MGHLLYLMFRCDGDVMESLDLGGLRDLNTPHGIKEKFARIGLQTLTDVLTMLFIGSGKTKSSQCL